MKDIFLTKDAVIDFGDIEISISYKGAKKIIHELNVDEIFDAINGSIGKGNITRDQIFERICDDYKEELSELLQKFWGRRSDACPLECTEHEEQIGEWEDWINSGM